MSNQLMQAVGSRIIEVMNDRIKQGVDLDGKKFSYSARPFARPAGGLLQKIHTKLKADEKKGGSRYFQNKGSGKLWVNFTGGYREFREMSGRSANGDFLQFTGKMLSSVRITKVTDDSVEIGFNDRISGQLAFYQNFSGVGKSRKLWRWFGLNETEQERLAEFIQSKIQA